MKILLAFLIVVSVNTATASFNDSFLEASFGYPTAVSIENPDGTHAYYDGIAFKTQFHYNFANSRSDTAYGFTAHFKYLNIDNTKKGSLTENGRHKAFGAGVFVKSSGFYLGVNYAFAKADHEATGVVYALDSFKYNPISVDISYTIRYGSLLEVGPAFSYTMADFSKDETGLSKDSPYSEQIVWLKILFYYN